jgi:PadR family transcriptional regulator, regulatory protein PadR
MLRDFFLGFIKIHILHHAAQHPVFGFGMIAELRRHGYPLSPGTLYPILRQLTVAGHLAKRERIVDGKVRKYYTITAPGRRALDAARPQILELVNEVLDREPARRAGRRPSRRRGSARPRAVASAEHTRA